MKEYSDGGIAPAASEKVQFNTKAHSSLRHYKSVPPARPTLAVFEITKQLSKRHRPLYPQNHPEKLKTKTKNLQSVCGAGNASIDGRVGGRGIQTGAHMETITDLVPTHNTSINTYLQYRQFSIHHTI